MIPTTPGTRPPVLTNFQFFSLFSDIHSTFITNVSHQWHLRKIALPVIPKINGIFSPPVCCQREEAVGGGATFPHLFHIFIMVVKTRSEAENTKAEHVLNHRTCRYPLLLYFYFILLCFLHLPFSLLNFVSFYPFFLPIILHMSLRSSSLSFSSSFTRFPAQTTSEMQIRMVTTTLFQFLVRGKPSERGNTCLPPLSPPDTCSLTIVHCSVVALVSQGALEWPHSKWNTKLDTFILLPIMEENGR